MSDVEKQDGKPVEVITSNGFGRPIFRLTKSKTPQGTALYRVKCDLLGLDVTGTSRDAVVENVAGEVRLLVEEFQDSASRVEESGESAKST